MTELPCLEFNQPFNLQVDDKVEPQIQRLPSLTSFPSTGRQNPQKENKWLRRIDQSKSDLIRRLEEKTELNSTRTEKKNVDFATKPPCETFFVPVTPSQTKREKLDSDAQTPRQRKLLREITNVRSEDNKTREGRYTNRQPQPKNSSRQPNKSSAFFVSLNDSNPTENKISANLSEQGAQFSSVDSRPSTRDALMMLKQVDTCFFCGRSVNMCNREFHNEAKCQNITREKTFTISNSNRTSRDNPLSFSTQGLFDNSSMTLPNLHCSDIKSKLSPRSNLCNHCKKPITKWTTNYHNNKLCQQQEITRQRTMMILRNSENEDSRKKNQNSDYEADNISLWCPQGVRNSQELENLRSLMKTPKFKFGKTCHNCGKKFGTKSLPIHLQQCQKRSFSE